MTIVHLRQHCKSCKITNCAKAVGIAKTGGLTLSRLVHGNKERRRSLATLACSTKHDAAGTQGIRRILNTRKAKDVKNIPIYDREMTLKRKDSLHLSVSRSFARLMECATTCQVTKHVANEVQTLVKTPFAGAESKKVHYFSGWVLFD